MVVAELEDAILEVRAISKTFGHVVALRNVSCALHAGEVVALVGDNGAGKSTLVKVLSGIHQPDAGEILLRGEPVTIQQPSDAISEGMSTVYQDLALVDTLDVGKNIFLGQIPRRFGLFVDKSSMYSQSASVLERLGISMPSVRVQVGELSGGQRQAVAIARALAHDSTVVLLDEPTAALGVEQQARVNELIRSLRDEGCAVLVISHNLEHVFSIADRIIVLRRGEVVADIETLDTTRSEVVGHITGAV